MDLGIKNKVAFIAASSQGLGKSVALEMAKEGAEVILCARRRNKLEEASKEIARECGFTPMIVAGDIALHSDRDHIVRTVLEKHSSIDILVTNTGGPPSGKFESFKDADWENAYNTLLASAVGLINGFLPGMRKKKWGRILAITSTAVKQPINGLILSNSVRASVAGLVKTLAAEVAADNITVNNIMPGYTETDRLKELASKNPGFANAKSEIPMGRFGRPEEFAAAVTFLASERASFITGVSLAVDGGWTKGLF